MSSLGAFKNALAFGCYVYAFKRIGRGEMNNRQDSSIQNTNAINGDPMTNNDN